MTSPFPVRTLVSPPEPVRHGLAGLTAVRRTLGRIVDAVAGSSRRKAERNAAQDIAHGGGGMTGSIERSPSAVAGGRTLLFSRPGYQP